MSVKRSDPKIRPKCQKRNRALPKKTKLLNRSQIKPGKLQTRKREEKRKKEREKKKKERPVSNPEERHNFKLWGP